MLLHSLDQSLCQWQPQFLDPSPWDEHGMGGAFTLNNEVEEEDLRPWICTLFKLKFQVLGLSQAMLKDEGMFYQPCSVKGNKTQNFSFFSNLTLNKKHFLYQHPFCGLSLSELFIVIEICLIRKAFSLEL